MDLRQLGWTTFFAESFQPFAEDGFEAARVFIGHRCGYQLISARGELVAEVSGRFRHEAARPADFPAVGDWVAMAPVEGEAKAVIHAVLPRRTKFSRGAAGDRAEEQILASNIDDVFIVASLNAELNLRRIERYLTLAWESGANPVLILTKADLCDTLAEILPGVEEAARGVPVHAVSSVTGQGMDRLAAYLGRGRTVALLGSSGVGKSTLINHFFGEELLAIQPVREKDDKGRHTTTHRELIALPCGGLVIDTPGLRELQLWDGAEGVVDAFTDIESLARQCRFRDCGHMAEPGCAVRRAVESGALERARLESHQKLAHEARPFGLKHDKRAQAEIRRKWTALAKSRRSPKTKSRGRNPA
jgi:ribosome biogenesis GTPase